MDLRLILDVKGSILGTGTLWLEDCSKFSRVRENAMTNVKFGKLEDLPLREAWEHEAHSFTP